MTALAPNALVLVAESDPFNLRLLEEVCEAAGHDVVSAGCGSSALALLSRRRPDLALVDVALLMPAVDRSGDAGRGGLEVVRVLKSDPDLAAIPLIVTTHADDDDARRDAIALGAEDYVSRPYRVFEIQQRIRNALRRARAERRLISTTEDDLLDPLTRTGSAAQMHISLEYEVTRAARYGHPLTCISVRAPELDQVLTERGREQADTLFAQLAHDVRACVRAIDHVFRAGRDELVLILPETSSASASVVVERLLARREGARRDGSPRTSLALEIGVAGRPELGTTDGVSLLCAARLSRCSMLDGGLGATLPRTG